MAITHTPQLLFVVIDLDTQQTRDVHPMSVQRWAGVKDSGSTLTIIDKSAIQNKSHF